MRRRKVIVHLSGGLGNQMFQYMAGAGLAKRTGRELAINLNWFLNPTILHRNNVAYLTKRKIDIIQFENVSTSRVDRWPTPRDGRMERLINRLSESRRKSLGIGTEDDFENGDWINGEDVGRLFGFFMSPKYFLGVAPKPFFDELNPPMSEWSMQTSNEISRSRSIGVHIRLGDYVSLGDKVIPTEAYFVAGIARLKSRLGEDSQVYLFTDEPDRLSDLFPDLTSLGITISPPSHTTPAENLIVLSKCSAFVCSNSTFSWWGAELSGVSTSLMVRPSYFYTERPHEDTHSDLWSPESVRLHPITGVTV